MVAVQQSSSGDHAFMIPMAIFTNMAIFINACGPPCAPFAAPVYSMTLQPIVQDNWGDDAPFHGAKIDSLWSRCGRQRNSWTPYCCQCTRIMKTQSQLPVFPL